MSNIRWTGRRRPDRMKSQNKLNMKKLLAIAAAVLLSAGALSAQNLGNLLGSLGSSGLGSTVSKVIYGFTGNLTAVDLPGHWTYTGSAIALGSDNVLSNVAGSAVSGTAETKVNEYLEKVGLSAGSMEFTFNQDLTFSCTVRGIPVSGTWKTYDDGNKVQLQFGKTLKFLNLDGKLIATPGGCQMLFNGSKFLSFAKTVMSVVAKQSATAGAINSLAGNYNDMQIGFTLKKN